MSAPIRSPAGRCPPMHRRWIRLHSYLVLTFDAAAGSYAVAGSSASTRCAAAGRRVPTLAPGGASYVPHPYPVTPYHADYLEQFDLAQQAKAQYATRPATAPAGASLRIRAIGSLAATLVPPDSNRGRQRLGRHAGGGRRRSPRRSRRARARRAGSVRRGPSRAGFRRMMLYAGHLHDAAAAALLRSGLSTPHDRRLSRRGGAHRPGASAGHDAGCRLRARGRRIHAAARAFQFRVRDGCRECRVRFAVRIARRRFSRAPSS